VIQKPLFVRSIDENSLRSFPSTRFQGSKRKIIDWLWTNLENLQFDSVLDVFGGTGAVSYLFKCAGKQVTYNDKLSFNWNIGTALVENSSVTLSSKDVDLILSDDSSNSIEYPTFIQSTFENIYFTNEENAWLDRIIFNINHLVDNPTKRAMAKFAVFQSCIIKRPYNLFHRANLYMRSADVKRSFGNKTTWDTPFEIHFRNFVKEANTSVFDNHRQNKALNLDAIETPVGHDLVYLDPPYLNSKGIGVNYRDFYHFLEGLMHYDNWESLVDYKSRHRRLSPEYSPWNNSKTILTAFEEVIARHQKSILIISYRDDGIPSKDALVDLLSKYKSHVREAKQTQKYALALRASHELLLIAE
jgi:adenine-specific DNA-methyltransferase